MGNYIVFFITLIIIFVCIQATLEYNDFIFNKSADQVLKLKSTQFMLHLFGRICKMMAVLTALVIALIPEGLTTAFLTCIQSFSNDELLSHHYHIIFSKIVSLETMGQVNCVCIDIDNIIDFTKWEEIPGNYPKGIEGFQQEYDEQMAVFRYLQSLNGI